MSTRDVTIYDVAKALNISPSTVSRGLKDHPHIHADTKKRIKAMAKEMGYQQNKFASSLRKRSTETIGVVVPKLNSYFMATVIAGMEEITNQFGYGLIISQSQESGKRKQDAYQLFFTAGSTDYWFPWPMTPKILTTSIRYLGKTSRLCSLTAFQTARDAWEL